MSQIESANTIEAATLRSLLKNQYRAALAMLREALDQCPESLWANDGHRNSFWQIAYHTLFFTHLYLQRSEFEFRPWKDHQSAVQHEDGIAGPADPNSTLPLIPEPYTKEQVLEYWQFCNGIIDGAIDAMNLNDAASGFTWYKVSKLEHQFISLRHIQHHTGQLADRLRASVGVGTKWVHSRPA